MVDLIPMDNCINGAAAKEKAANLLRDNPDCMVNRSNAVVAIPTEFVIDLIPAVSARTGTLTPVIAEPLRPELIWEEMRPMAPEAN
jgi:hypothetical protein